MEELKKLLKECKARDMSACFVFFFPRLHREEEMKFVCGLCPTPPHSRWDPREGDEAHRRWDPRGSRGRSPQLDPLLCLPAL